MGMTITEGLAEIKTIGKRLEKKRQFIMQYIARQDGLRDPLLNEGGSAASIEKERQAIRDLEERIVTIRRAIQVANAATPVTVGGQLRTVADWLVWRREVSTGEQNFLRSMGGILVNLRQDAAKKGFVIAPSPDQAKSSTDIIVNVDEQSLAKDIETLETTLGDLDGQLSLKNATVTIEV